MKPARLFLAILLVVGGAVLAAAIAPSGERTGVDLALLNGNIYTGEPGLGRVQALAVQSGKIVAAGMNDDILAWIGSNTDIIDLEGRFVMPGFNDAHTHLASGGLRMLRVNLEGTRSLAEFQQRLRERLEEFGPGEWIQGGGWDQSLWPSNRVPTRGDLDAVSTRHPMIFSRVDGHSVVVNSLALEKAGITRDTPAPYGGEIVKGENGEPTGWLKDAAIGLVGRLVPPPTFEQRVRALELALQEAARNGVTSIQDDSIRGESWDNFLALRVLRERGQLTLRITEWLPFSAPVDKLKMMREDGGSTDPWLKTGALKAVTDGSGGSLSAAMLEPFANHPDNRGLLLIAPEQLREMVIERDAAGFQITLHAIGDRANRVALDAFEAAKNINRRPNTRHKIEHAQFVHPKDIPRFQGLGVIASMQPCHLLNDLRWAPTILGPDRQGEGYPWHSLLESGAVLALGTDFPVEPLTPMRNLYASLTREFEDGGPEGGWLAEEKLTIEQALRAYTWGSAYAEFEEHRKGTLAPGKFADLVVLSQDITQVSPEEILRTEVLLTLVGGRVVYQKE
ncbi:MAG: amidohydrolase [Terriglobia bacterium]